MSAKKKTSSGRKKTAKKTSRRNYRLRAILAAAAMAAAVAVGLHLYDGAPAPDRSSSSAAPTASPKPVSPEPAFRYLEDVRIEVESLLLRNGASLEGIRDNLVADTLVFEVEGEYPSPYLMAGFRDRLERLSTRLQLFAEPAKGRFRVDLGRRTLCKVMFAAGYEPAADAPRARIAIVMDDLGREVKTARELLALEIPVTFSILPGTPKAAEVANMAHRARREVLVHIPMEPQGYPAIDPGADALFLAHSAEELRSRLRAFWRSVPHAVGGNNHMGSRFTEDAESMTGVLGFMRENALFFVDSRTSGRSVAHRLARESGVASVSRDVFLDNKQDVEAIRRQIRKLKRIARSRGQAVGICHPYPETLEALRLETASLDGETVEVVPVSRLLDQSGS